MQVLRHFIRHAVCEVTLFQKQNRTDRPENQAGKCRCPACASVRLSVSYPRSADCAASLSACVYQCIKIKYEGITRLLVKEEDYPSAEDRTVDHRTTRGCRRTYTYMDMVRLDPQRHTGGK